MIKVGDIVEVRFLDHSEAEHGDEDELDFTVWGRLVKETSRAYTVETWGYSDPERKRDNNCERFTIVKAAILEARTL
jgi:hypothetical protein